MALLLVAAGAWQLGDGLWIQGKAWLARALIADAWSRTLQGDRAVKPWPWADTWPVARVTVPRLGIERYVLAGAHGATLAFGPGHASQTPLPGEEGNSLIGGHRDTHLAFLGILKEGDEIVVQRRDGMLVSYRVSSLQVLDRRDTWIAGQDGPSRVTLVTCWPLDAWRAGSDERYAVTALATGLVVPAKAGT